MTDYEFAKNFVTDTYLYYLNVNSSNPIHSVISVTTPYNVTVEAYKDSVIPANKLGDTLTTSTSGFIELEQIAFDKAGKLNASEVDYIDLIIAVTNNSATDIGVYFWDGETEVDTDEDDDGIVWGNFLVDGIDYNYSFYHQIPANGGSPTTEYMHVYLTLTNIAALIQEISINLAVEEYTATSYASVDVAKGFVKLASNIGSVPAFGSSSSGSANKNITHVVIPYGTTMPTNYTFSYCTALKTASLPSSLTTMANYAFAYFVYYCMHLHWLFFAILLVLLLFFFCKFPRIFQHFCRYLL